MFANQRSIKQDFKIHGDNSLYFQTKDKHYSIFWSAPIIHFIKRMQWTLSAKNLNQFKTEGFQGKVGLKPNLLIGRFENSKTIDLHQILSKIYILQLKKLPK